MLPTPTPPVKSTAPSPLPNLLKEQAIIWASLGGLALLLYVTGLDTTLAIALNHNPDTPFAGTTFTKLMRQFGALPAALLALASLIALFWPGLWRKRPTLYRAAAVMILTSVLGVGLLNQIVVKNLADRPRPRESVLAMQAPTTQSDAFRGNSMPSGHAAMGFVLAAPFFPLRRRKPALAKAFLAAGVTAGLTIGLSRMLLGAHFATDVLISGAITLSSAALLTAFLSRYTRISHTILALGTLAFALAVILGNRFTSLQLTLPLPAAVSSFNLPCTPTSQPVPGTQTPTLTVSLNGYGAPLSNLKLMDNQGTISIQRHLGLYHSLTCTAKIALPTS